MEKIKRFGINFQKLGGDTPFFQVPSNRRIRFGMELFKNYKTKRLRNILDDIFHREERIDTTFVAGYVSNNKRLRQKTGIGKFIKIINWKETIIEDSELQSTVIFASVRKINSYDVYRYCKKISQGYPQAYVAFYNDSFFAFVNSDVLDIISDNEDLIAQLKIIYAADYDKYYEGNNNIQ